MKNCQWSLVSGQLLLRLILALATVSGVMAQRTPVKVNDAVVNNPNFRDTSLVTLQVSGSNVDTSVADEVFALDDQTVDGFRNQPSNGSGLFSPLLTGTTNFLVSFATNEAVDLDLTTHSDLNFTAPNSANLNKLVEIGIQNDSDTNLLRLSASVAPPFTGVSLTPPSGYSTIIAKWARGALYVMPQWLLTTNNGILKQTSAGPIAVELATQTGTHASPSTTNPLNVSGVWSTNSACHTIWYGATGELDLPTAASYTNKGLLVYNTGAFTITLDPNGSEVIVREGTVQSGGVSMTLSSGAGNYVWLFSDGVRWITLGKNGTLAQGS